MAKAKNSCVEPTRGPILKEEETLSIDETVRKEEIMTLARVGHEAPDFETNAYFEGGFKNITLSDYKGKWIVICFYPGDFTFV
jgi:hypothetical protein